MGCTRLYTVSISVLVMGLFQYIGVRVGENGSQKRDGSRMKVDPPAGT